MIVITIIMAVLVICRIITPKCCPGWSSCEGTESIIDRSKSMKAQPSGASRAVYSPFIRVEV